MCGDAPLRRQAPADFLRLRRSMCGDALLRRKPPPDFLRLRRRSPLYLTMIGEQRFNFQRLIIPLPRTRVHKIIRMLNQARTNRILVNIIHLLHQRVLAVYLEGVRVMLIKGESVVAILSLDAEFRERFVVVVSFEVVDHAPRDDAVCKFERVRDRACVVRDQMLMVGHQDVGEQEKPSGASGFGECVAGDLRESGRSKYREPVVADRG